MWQKLSYPAMSFGYFPYTEFWHGLPLVIPSHHVKYKCFMTAASIDSSLQMSISAKAVGMANTFKLPSQYKTCSPAPFLQLILSRFKSGSLL